MLQLGKKEHMEYIINQFGFGTKLTTANIEYGCFNRGRGGAENKEYSLH
jgi:hypothetical protein